MIVEQASPSHYGSVLRLFQSQFPQISAEGLNSLLYGDTLFQQEYLRVVRSVDGIPAAALIMRRVAVLGDSLLNVAMLIIASEPQADAGVCQACHDQAISIAEADGFDLILTTSPGPQQVQYPVDSGWEELMPGDPGKSGHALTVQTTASLHNKDTLALWQTPNLLLVRLLHRENLLRGFSLNLSDHWIRAGKPEGRVTFRGPYGTCTLISSKDFLTVESNDLPEPGYLGQSSLVEMLSGDLRTLDRRPATQNDNFLRALFPEGKGVLFE